MKEGRTEDRERQRAEAEGSAVLEEHPEASGFEERCTLVEYGKTFHRVNLRGASLEVKSKGR